jgi:hypothetical protein
VFSFQLWLQILNGFEPAGKGRATSHRRTFAEFAFLANPFELVAEWDSRARRKLHPILKIVFKIIFPIACNFPRTLSIISTNKAATWMWSGAQFARSFKRGGGRNSQS